MFNGGHQKFILREKTALLLIFSVFLILDFGHKTEGAACGASQTIGVADPSTKATSVDATAGNYLLLSNDNKYTVDCCGYVYEWNYYPDAAGSVEFQIWRHNSGTTYDIVDTNTHTAGAGGSTVTASISDANRILVNTGDVIGWYSAANIIKYGNTGSYYFIGSQQSTTYDTSAATSSSNRGHAVNLKIIGSNAPSFTSAATLTLSDDTAVSTSVFTVTATDADSQDVASLTYAMTSSSNYFSFNAATQEITTKAALTPLATGTHTIDFSVTDQCGNIGTQTLTITINGNTPNIVNLNGAATVNEDVSAETNIFALTVTDTSVDDFADCIVSAVSPNVDVFFAKIDPATSAYAVYIESNPNPALTSASYVVDVKCEDISGLSVTKELTVSVTQNAAPVVSAFPASVTINSSSTSIGEVIYTVVSTDAENDQLYYNMTTSPAGAPFEIFNSGDILTTSSLVGLTTPFYDLNVYVYDTYNLVGPSRLTIKIGDINNAPTITNLPLISAKLVEENEPLSASVFQVSVSDSDAGQTHTYSATYNPGWASSYFSIDSSTGLISTSSSKTINYETLPGGVTSITISVTVSDGTDTDTKDLALVIGNKNEPPSFQKAYYIISGLEGPASTSFGNPNFIVVDEDTGDSYTYSQNCSEFYMNPTTADVILAIPYDLDAAGVQTTFECIATVADAEYTGTATLSIQVGYDNDNQPRFSIYSYTFYVASSTGIGFTIGTVTATDLDYSTDGTFYYTLDQSTLATDYFGINNNGQIYVKKDISSLGSTGATLAFKAIATDTGGRFDQAAIAVVIPLTTTVATTTTTDRYRDFGDIPGNVAWLTAISAALLGLTLVGIYLLYKYGFFSKILELLIRCGENCHCNTEGANCDGCRERCRRDSYDFETESESEEEFDDRTVITTIGYQREDSYIGWNAWRKDTVL